MSSNDKPLVSLSMMTYNQEKYVRDSVRGMLAQTYEPLEIVISDDHSTDGTWDIIKEEVESYKKSGGIHTNIVLNRNEKNLGIIRHCQSLIKRCHGLILVGNAGDDISLPNRVSRIVDVWDEAGRPNGWIYHGGRKISRSGRCIGDLSNYGVNQPLGAASVYIGVSGDDFPVIKDSRCYEDWILSRRAMMIGKVLAIKDELILYRWGVGVSTSFSDFRQRSGKNASAMVKTCEQIELDAASHADLISPELYAKILDRNSEVKQEFLLKEVLFNDELFSRRWKAFKAIVSYKMLFNVGNGLLLMTYVSCLFPKGRFDFVVNFFARLSYMAHIAKYVLKGAFHATN